MTELFVFGKIIDSKKEQREPMTERRAVTG